MMRPLRAAALFAVVLVLYLAFRFLGRPWELPFAADWTEGLLKIGIWVVPCLLVLRASLRVGYLRVFQELGLAGGVARGYGFGWLSTLPMMLVLPLQGTVHLNASVLVGTVLLGSFAEEVLFRGFLFGQLVRRAHWPVRTAMVASAFFFGLAHLGNVAVQDSRSVVFAAGEVGMTAAGGLLLAWIMWQSGSLWPAIGLHTFMNLWWEVFGVEDWASRAQSGATAIGPGVANIARFASIGLAVYLTLRRRNRKSEIWKSEI